jgi:8-oxo-dGTP diphosphatase
MNAMSKGEYSTTILTNMIMLYRDDGAVLVQDRLKKDWPGLNFPGGHVERYESLEASAIREMKEETGLDVCSLEQCGVFEWNVPEENLRHLVILYRSHSFSGELVSSSEGKVFWLQPSEFSHYPLSVDFDKLYALMSRGLK